MKYIAVLGRQDAISLAELESLFYNVQNLGGKIASFESEAEIKIERLGGCLKIAKPLEVSPLEYLQNLPEGKITLGISDYSGKKSGRQVGAEALKMKKILTRHGRSVRIVPNKEAVLSTATAFHNGLGLREKAVELIKFRGEWFASVGVQNIEAYAKRDQNRPARDAKVGMLPPKLAQILINLCGNLPENSVLLDPFCGTGVVLQEAFLMGYQPYGTDIDERMVRYSKRNLEWLDAESLITVGDATEYTWQQPIDAVACETYLGRPMSNPPAEIKLKEEKQKCGTIILGFLKNLAKQIKSRTPVMLGVPAWLRPDGSYSRLDLLDEIEKLGYNVKRFKTASQSDLLYHREGQVVAREIIVLRKK